MRGGAMRTAAISVLFASLFVLLPTRAPLALTVEKTSLEKLVRDSHLIIMGEVVSSRSVWEGKNIFTYIRVRISERLKGEHVRSEVSVKQLGGTVGTVSEIVDGSPTFRAGEEVILFLVAWKDAYWVHSIVLGKFSILEEEGERYAMNDLRNIGLVDPISKREITRVDEKISRIPVDTFLAEVRSVIER